MTSKENNGLGDPLASHKSDDKGRLWNGKCMTCKCVINQYNTRSTAGAMGKDRRCGNCYLSWKAEQRRNKNV